MMKKGASVLALLAGACWGMTGVFFRQLTDYFSQMEIVFIKMLVASLVLGIIILVKDPKLFRVKLKDLWVFLILGIVAMLLFNFFYFETMMHTSVAVAVSLLYTGPAFVILVSALLFKEKITMQKIFALVLIICGCACASGILVGEQYLTMIGLCFGVGSGFCYGMYTIGTRMAMDRGYQSYTIAFYAMFICLITSIPFADMGHIVANICPHSVIIGLSLSVFTCLSPYLLFSASMRWLEPGRAAMLAASEPIVAALISIFILREPADITVVLGIGLIVGGIILVNAKLKKNME
ncbi:MAG: EamA family transporter [Firmicutes bacterium]|nr:EamA family transporter [Bacillota bacterium]